jgi:UDP-glucose-4-epimerase GalE
MRVLVTGGCGYVGSHAVRDLAEAGHDILIYDDLSTGQRGLSEGFRLIEGDVADISKLAPLLRETDAVMHFAASAYVGESVANPRKYFHNNVESGLKLLDAILASPVRKLIFSSTCATYGAPQQLPVLETCPQVPLNPYGASKLFFEHALKAYSLSHGLRSVALRYFNAAGAHPDGSIGELHDPETHLIPLALKAILGTEPPLTVFGDNLQTPDGTCVRDFVHVCDLASAHVKALAYLEAGGPSTQLNIGTGVGISILEVLEAVRRVTGLDVPHRFAKPRVGDPAILFADSGRAQKVLDWSPQYGIDEIIATAWHWEQKIGNIDVSDVRINMQPEVSYS